LPQDTTPPHFPATPGRDPGKFGGGPTLPLQNLYVILSQSGFRGCSRTGEPGLRMTGSTVYASNVRRRVARHPQVNAKDPLYDRPDRSGPESLLGLQRLAGNAAVTALIHRQTLSLVDRVFAGPVSGGLVQRCPGCGGTCGGS